MLAQPRAIDKAVQSTWYTPEVAEARRPGLSTTLTFPGLVLDTHRMEMCLPEGRLEELKQLTAKWMARKAGKKSDILLLIGKLAHAAKIIFLKRMINVTHKAKQLDHVLVPLNSNSTWCGGTVL